MANGLHRRNLTGTVVTGQQRNGLVYLATLYLFLDLVRPAFVWHFPKVIAVIMVIAWIMKADKVRSAQNVCFVLFVAILAIDIVVAENDYAAVWTTYGMLMLLMGVCIPLINFTDTLPKLRHVVNALLVIFLYIALYAIPHAGYGPAREEGGQDENYVAAAMNLAIPLAWFSFLAEKSKWKKACFASLVCLFIFAIVVGLSRGGLLGLLCALGYSVMKTRKKGIALSAAIALGGFLIFAATTDFVKCNKYGTATRSEGSDCPFYWEHMSTITQTSEGTADMRFEFWQIATREFLSYPLTGVGGGNFRWRMPEFQSPEQIEKFGRLLAYEAHSTYFQLLAEMGLAGCIVFGLILLFTYRDYRHIERLSAKAAARAMERGDEASNEDFKWIQSYGRGLMGGLLGYLVSVAFLSALYYSHMWIAMSLMVALRMIATRRIGEDGRPIVLADAKR
jgi:O-antigen ligase